MVLVSFGWGFGDLDLCFVWIWGLLGVDIIYFRFWVGWFYGCFCFVLVVLMWCLLM